MPDPDLIIRTAGEMRLSNFLLWQAAYAEYWSTPICWPDFGREELYQALRSSGGGPAGSAASSLKRTSQTDAPAVRLRPSLPGPRSSCLVIAYWATSGSYGVFNLRWRSRRRAGSARPCSARAATSHLDGCWSAFPPLLLLVHALTGPRALALVTDAASCWSSCLRPDRAVSDAGRASTERALVDWALTLAPALYVGGSMRYYIRCARLPNELAWFWVTALMSAPGSATFRRFFVGAPRCIRLAPRSAREVSRGRRRRPVAPPRLVALIARVRSGVAGPLRHGRPRAGHWHLRHRR